MDKTDTQVTVTGSNSAVQSLEAVHSLQDQTEAQKMHSYHCFWTSRTKKRLF